MLLIKMKSLTSVVGEGCSIDVVETSVIRVSWSIVIFVNTSDSVVKLY
jgi:hypothetical protein